MHVTPRFDGQRPQKRVIVHRLERPAHTRPWRPASPLPYSLLERGTAAVLLGLEGFASRLTLWLVRWMARVWSRRSA